MLVVRDDVSGIGGKGTIHEFVVIVVGLGPKMLIFFERLLPRSVVRRVVYMIQKKPAKKTKEKKK